MTARARLLRQCACASKGGGCSCSARKRLDRSPASHATPASAPPIVHDVLRSPGRPLDAPMRAEMETRFGHDLGRVRIHDDARAADSARSVDALAYTVGSHVVFGRGQFRPSSAQGRRLLAHELAHTIQQSSAAPSGDLEIGGAHDPEEREADAVADGRMPASALGSHALRRHLARAPAEPGSPRQVAEDDGVGPAEARRALATAIGEERLRRLEQAIDGQGEREAEGAASAVAAGGRAQVAPGSVAPGTVQLVHPAVIIGGALLALVVCASGFFHYAMSNYRHKGDKWMHCWTSCKIATYCGSPLLIGPTWATLVGAGKEFADYVCDVLGGPCGAEWDDFVADMEGIACATAGITSTCVDCCDKKRP